MKCPACGNQMTEITVESIKVDVCMHGCGGIWFDRFELQRMDEGHESAGEMLLDIEVNEATRVDPSARRKCPKCRDMIMMRHFFSMKREIEVDECPGCTGFWVDRGELWKIREQFTTEADRDQATEDYFTKMFNDDLEAMKEKTQGKLDRARKFARLFRFVCPSYYIPGKQRGGAF